MKSLSGFSRLVMSSAKACHSEGKLADGACQAQHLKHHDVLAQQLLDLSQTVSPATI